MKNLSRLTPVCMLAALLLLGFVFQATASGQKEAKEMGPVTITFWHVWGGSRIPLMEKQISDFQAKNPNITVNDTLIDQGGMDQKYLTAIAGGVPPDAIMVHGSRFFPLFAIKKVLIPLDDYLKRDGMKGPDIWYQAEWENYRYDNKTYGLPLATTAGAYMFFYDKTDFQRVGLADKAPKTWQELEDFAKKLTVKSGNKVEKIGFDVNSFTNFPFAEWLYTNNGKYNTTDGKKFLFDSVEGLETLKWMVGFTDRLYGGYDPLLGFTDKPHATGRIQRGEWFNGNIAMHVDGVWHFLQLQKTAPDKKYGVALMPYNGNNSSAKHRNLAIGGWCYSIPKGSKNADAAWEWIKYACAGEGNLNFFKAQTRPSPVREHNEDPYFAQNNPFWGIVQESLAVSDRVTATPVQAEVDKTIVQMTEESLLHKRSPEEAMKIAVETAQKAVDNFWANQ